MMLVRSPALPVPLYARYLCPLHAFVTRLLDWTEGSQNLTPEATVMLA
jgi:hypothetical protein